MSVTVTPFKHNKNFGHFNEQFLEGYIYDNIFSKEFLTNVKAHVTSLVERGERKTFLTSNTEIQFEGQSKKIINHKQNGREQIVIFDLTLTKDYYYQTIDTIKKWSDSEIEKQVNPIFIKTIKLLETLEPFNINKNDWVFNRIHINYLAPFRNLTLHWDTNPALFNDAGGESNNPLWKAEQYSVTFYLYDHKEGLGGEFWTPCGFVYKPKANTALCINGSKVFHGVTENIDIKPRLAFTVRALNKNSLYLPGDPSKSLYNPLGSL